MDSGAARRIDNSKLKALKTKTYVLDTNVLLHDPTAIVGFKEHHVVIPMTVLEELDDIKDRHDKTVSREARIAIQLIDKVLGSASTHEIQDGVEIPGSNVGGCVRYPVDLPGSTAHRQRQYPLPRRHLGPGQGQSHHQYGPASAGGEPR